MRGSPYLANGDQPDGVMSGPGGSNPHPLLASLPIAQVCANCSKETFGWRSINFLGRDEILCQACFEDKLLEWAAQQNQEAWAEYKEDMRECRD
jgi:hypothetical protein